ncbi:M20 family metallo-hydrolase [Sulfolobus acidocaldarius]|uniref:M20 family metallo-hydrolase n=1 Tax=Sulfolobus acidocaldarius TaxID=2285 RepID=UPI00159C106A|nr:M20 family metallo-hydrolase [Sulfolobus acidocaldarius]
MDENRFVETFHKLSNIGWTEEGAMRVALNEYDIQVRIELTKILSSLGAEIKVDDAGNIIANIAGEKEDKIAIGSHMDSVPYGGKYDGFYGVMAGLEILRGLREHGVRTNHTISLIDFTNEEGSRFKPSLMGSGLTTGVFNREYVYSIVDKDGITFEKALERSGFLGNESNRIIHDKPKFYLELHIEQGPVLEEEGYQIGIPLGIVGLTVCEFKFKGQSSQAGPTPMDRRRDALVGASKFITNIRDYARRTSDLRATVGIVNLKPNIYNAIPGEVTLTLDLRSIEKEDRERALREAKRLAEEIADQEKLEVEEKHLWTAEQVKFDKEVVSVIEKACNQLGLKYKFLYSWAGHDAQYMTRVSRVGMIFIPSHLGISHSKEEYSSDRDMVNGLRVLAKTVELLDGLT